MLATRKQKNYVIILEEKTKVPFPYDLETCTMEQADEYIREHKPKRTRRTEVIRENGYEVRLKYNGRGLEQSVCKSIK